MKPLPQSERRVVRAAMRMFSHPAFNRGLSWVITKDGTTGMAVEDELWKACAALRRKGYRGK